MEKSYFQRKKEHHKGGSFHRFWRDVFGGSFPRKLKPSKTSITHTLNKHEGKCGFDFLGFTIRQFPISVNRSGSNGYTKLGFKTLIKPSLEKQKTHLKKIAKVIDTHKNAKQLDLIIKLNPIIIGWGNYYSKVVSKKVFARIDHLVFQKLRAWALYRCRKTNKKGVFKKYWHTVGKDNWVFSTKDGWVLAKCGRIPILRYTKVQGKRSPYDGGWAYWSSRMGKHPELTDRVAKLLKIQKGKCSECGLYFKNEDLLEVDHIKPKRQKGEDKFSNLQLLHRHCHDKKTANECSIGTSDK